MTYNTSEIMKRAWKDTKMMMKVMGYWPSQLRKVFAAQLTFAWKRAKKAAGKAVLTAKEISFQIMRLEPKVLRQHDTRHLFTSAGSMAGIDRSKVKYLRGDIVLGDGADVGYMHGIAAHKDVEEIGLLISQKCTVSYSDLVEAVMNH